MRPIFALCCLFLFAILTPAQNRPVDFAELEKTVAAELKENNTPGAALVVVSGERVLFIKNFGTTSAEDGAGVMLKGRWFAQAELDKPLEEIAPRLRHALDGKH